MTQQPYAPQYPGYPPAPMPQQGPVQGYPAPAYQPAPAPYPPQQYAPAPPAPVQPPLAQGSLDDYYSQPSTGGGAGLKFTGPNNQPLIGQSYLVQVTRPITSGDIQQQTDNKGVPLTWKDGRPKFVMIVPVQLLEPNPNHPDGLAKWYVKGASRDELARAMSEAQAPEGPPEAGAIIRVTLTGTRQSGPGMNPAHVFAVQYVRPQGAAPVAPPAAQAQLASVAPSPAPEAVQAPQYAAPPANYAPVQHQQYAPPVQAAPAPVAPQPVQQIADPVAAPAPPPEMPADQQLLLQQLLAAKTAAGQ